VLYINCGLCGAAISLRCSVFAVFPTVLLSSRSSAITCSGIRLHGLPVSTVFRDAAIAAMLRSSAITLINTITGLSGLSDPVASRRSFSTIFTFFTITAFFTMAAVFCVPRTVLHGRGCDLRLRVTAVWAVWASQCTSSTVLHSFTVLRWLHGSVLQWSVLH
jgi:hypothetical protein